MRYDSPSQPYLDSRLAIDGDSDMKRLIEDVNRYNGVGSHIPTSEGGLVPTRWNTTERVWEVYEDGDWVKSGIGGDQPASSGMSVGSLGFEIDGSGRIILGRSLILGGDLSVSGSVAVSSLTASRLLSTDANKNLASVADLASWIAGTANRVSVASDGDGTITLNGPQDIHSGASPIFAGLTVSGLTSELLKVNGSGVLAEAVEGTDYAGIDFANVFTAAQTIKINANGETENTTGLLLTNETAATSGNEQWPPALIFSGQHYRAGASETLKYAIAVEPDDAYTDCPRLVFYSKQGASAWVKRLELIRGQFFTQLGFRGAPAETVSNVCGSLYYTSDTATAGGDKFSPPIIMQGSGWKTNATAASQAMGMAALVAPEQGAANPIGVYKICYGTNTSNPVQASEILQANELFRCEWGDRLGVVVNDLSLNGFTFRVEGDTDANLLVTDGTTNAVKIGGAITSLVGFYGVTPVDQPAALTAALTSITHTAPGTPDYAIQDLIDSSVGACFGFATKDEGNTVLSVALNLQARVNNLEDRLQELGLLA